MTWKTKYTAKKALENGTHNFLTLHLGRPPWENNSATFNTLEVWKNADICYNWWKINGNKPIKLKKHFEFKSRKACISMIDKFKSNWIPVNDEKWLAWRDKNNG